jgi:hypothetical protein
MDRRVSAQIVFYAKKPCTQKHGTRHMSSRASRKFQ